MNVVVVHRREEAQPAGSSGELLICCCEHQGQAMKPKRRTSGRAKARVAFVRCQRTQPEKRREGQRGNISSGEVYKKTSAAVCSRSEALSSPEKAKKKVAWALWSYTAHSTGEFMIT